MGQSYTIGGDALQAIGHEYYAAQSFTPQVTHNLDCVDINLRTYDPARAPTIWVYLADAEHKPTGDYLSKSIRHYADDWNLYNVFRMRAIMSPTLLSEDIEYVIVIHAFALLTEWHMQWEYDNNDATYTRGIRLISNDYGATWDPHPGDDHMFAEFGTAPIPPPPPDPPTTKWLLVSIEQTLTATGYVIVVTTNVPCHLWMRWTTVVPKEHLIQRTKRGLPLMLEKYFCFDVYEDNEQEEAGDTLIHTFIKEPWPICETRYFYFHGEISGTPSPSTSSIFSKHRVLGPITVDFYPDPHPEITSVDGGVIHLETLTFMQLRAAPGSLSVDAVFNTWAYFRSSTTPNLWRDLRRIIYLYDTSSIPIGSTMQSATLTISQAAQADHTGNLPSLCVVSSSPASDTQLVPADYTTLGLVPLSEIKEWAELVGVVEHTFTLNALGLAAVIAGGITKLGMREAKFDMAGTQPNWGSNHATGFELYCVEKGGGFRPKLTVTYMPPP